MFERGTNYFKKPAQESVNHVQSLIIMDINLLTIDLDPFHKKYPVTEILFELNEILIEVVWFGDNFLEWLSVIKFNFLCY